MIWKKHPTVILQLTIPVFQITLFMFQYIITSLLIMAGHIGVFIGLYMEMQTVTNVITQAWTEMNVDMKVYIQSAVSLSVVHASSWVCLLVSLCNIIIDEFACLETYMLLYQLRQSMEQHEQVNINAPPHE